jgi:hypothetical protein
LVGNEGVLFRALLLQRRGVTVCDLHRVFQMRHFPNGADWALLFARERQVPANRLLLRDWRDDPASGLFPSMCLYRHRHLFERVSP